MASKTGKKSRNTSQVSQSNPNRILKFRLSQNIENELETGNEAKKENGKQAARNRSSRKVIRLTLYGKCPRQKLTQMYE